MTRLPSLLPLALLSSLLPAGCGSPGAGAADSGWDDAALASELWSEMDGYQGWGQVEPWIGVQPSSSVHGPYVQIWLDDIAQADIAAGNTLIADGGIVVKKGYDDAEGASPHGNLTVMWKLDGYDPEHLDWFWANLGDDGTVKAAGRVSACYDCHALDPTDYMQAW